MNILFLCTSNLNRSRTAEDYFRQVLPEHQYKSAGLSEKYCKKHNTTLCTTDFLEWADKVLVMEECHAARIKQYTGDKYFSKISIVDIKDKFVYGDHDLKQHLINSATRYLNKPNKPINT